MLTRATTAEGKAAREELHRLATLLDEALVECHALHHKIREIQLHIAQLSASADAGRPVAAVRGIGGGIG